MQNKKENLQKKVSTSAIVASLILAVILGMGITILNMYSELEFKKTSTLMYVENTMHKDRTLEETITPVAENNSLIFPGIVFDEILYIVERKQFSNNVTIYDRNNFPLYVSKSKDNFMLINKTFLDENDNVSIIILLKNGVSINLTSILKKASMINYSENTQVDSLITEVKSEASLDAFVKSLLLPSELYKIYIEDNYNASKKTMEISIRIPISMDLENNIIKEDLITTTIGCPFGKSRPLYHLVESNASTIVRHNEDTLHGNSEKLVVKAPAGRTYPVKDFYTVRNMVFSGIVSDDEGNPILKYKGRIDIIQALSVKPPTKSKCGNSFSIFSPKTQAYISIAISLEKLKPDEGVILILANDELGLVNGANTRPFSRNTIIQPSIERDKFIIIYSPPGSAQVASFREEIEYIKDGDFRLHQEQIKLNGVIQILN